MRPSQPRQACEACYTSKARCIRRDNDLNSACERCWQAGRECVSGIRRRPKERIVELEAQVAELTAAVEELKEQSRQAVRCDSGHVSLDTTPGSDFGPGQTQTSVFLFPDQLESSVQGLQSADAEIFTMSDPLELLDQVLSLEDQQHALDHYSKVTMTYFPIFPRSAIHLENLRLGRPVLLFAIATYASAGVFPETTQHQLLPRLAHLISYNLMRCGVRSVDMIQAVIVMALYFRIKFRSRHASIHQLLAWIVGDAIDHGLAGPHALRSPGADYFNMKVYDDLDGRRTWLALFAATASSAVLLRKPNVNVWTKYHQDCLESLSAHHGENQLNDRLLCKFVQGDELCLRIANRFQFFDCDRSIDMTEDEWWETTEHMQDEIRCKLVLDSLSSPDGVVHISTHLANIYLYEPILHTPTNKSTFGAPFIPDKIAAHDIAAPKTVTRRHRHALERLLEHCHRMVELEIQGGPNFLLNLTALSQIPRIHYALWILVKLHVALTAPGNTYGSVMTKEQLRLPQIFASIQVATEPLVRDSSSFNCQILRSYRYLESWYREYEDLSARFDQGRARE